MITDAGELLSLEVAPDSDDLAIATVRCRSLGVPPEAQASIEYKLTLEGSQVRFLKSIFDTGKVINIIFSGIHYVSQENDDVIHTVACRYFGVQLTQELLGENFRQ